MNELTYTRSGDYYIPDLKLSEQPEAPIGKYGRMRQRYLKEHRPGLYSSLILSEKLYPHLLEIDRAARERMDAMLPRMMEAAGVTEELKARDPMRWVGLMNTLKAQAEEVLFQELIYIMSTEQTPVFFAAPKYPAMLSKLAKGRTESYGDSARGPTWQSHEQRFPAALQ